MPSDYKILVLPPNAQTTTELGARVRDHRGWLEVLGAEWKSDALEFSKRFVTTSVWWSMQTPNDQVWLFCFHEGREVRELRFSAEEEGWAVNRGDGMPFEDTPALALWLRKWRSRKVPLTPRDGVDLLNAFIGTGPKKPKARKTAKARKKPKARKTAKARTKRAR